MRADLAERLSERMPVAADGRPVTIALTWRLDGRKLFVHGELVDGATTHRIDEGYRLLGWESLLPPLIAIGLALIFKDVLISLFLGVFAGTMILFDWNPFAAFARAIDSFIAPSLADPSNASIIIFTTLLGGMVGVIGKSGGTRGIVERLKPYPTSL